jgi:DNA-binding transcriptional MerR regulator
VFSIGDFAAVGRVSVRMLRHYDAIGLLTPAKTDPATGYRYYEADQLRRLNRIIALKDLCLTLGKVADILDDKVGTEELHGMLRLRRAQLEAQLTADATRLAGVEARLRMIEEEGTLTSPPAEARGFFPHGSSFLLQRPLHPRLRQGTEYRPDV